MAEDRFAPEAITVAYNPDLITWRFIRDRVKALETDPSLMITMPRILGN